MKALNPALRRIPATEEEAVLRSGETAFYH